MAGPYYRMPSGKLPMIDGKPVFITEAQFLGICCNMCQWKATYVWDCLEDEWILPTEEDETLEWVCAERDEGIYETDACTRTVYGEIVNCLVDPKPAAPTAPPDLTTEEKELCCASDCPCDESNPEEWPCGGLLEVYSIDQFDYKEKPELNNSQYRFKSSVVVTALPNNKCVWEGIGDAERRFHDGSDWEEWETLPDHHLRLSLVNPALFKPRWQIRSSPFVYEGVKFNGQNPIGNYRGNNNPVEESFQATVS